MGATRRLGTAAVILWIPLAMAGCAQPQGEAPTTTASPPEKTPTASTPSQAPGPTSAPVVIPPCDELVPFDAVQAEYADGIEAFHGQPEMQQQARTHIFGPAAVTALDAAEQSVHCGWGIPNSDGLSQIYVAELDPAVRDALMAELDASVFERSEEGGWVRYARSELGGIAPLHINYFFRDRVWVSELGSENGVLAREAMSRL